MNSRGKTVAQLRAGSSFMSEDKELMISRRFEKLHLANILFLHRKLEILEEQLKHFDDQRDTQYPTRFFDCEPPKDQAQLMTRIGETLKEFGSLFKVIPKL
jgi:hypothetical protein